MVATRAAGPSANGDVILATARARLRRDELEIDAGGRQLTARMPEMLRWGPSKEFDVVDDATGERVIDGKLISGGGPGDQEWAVTLSTGGTISWIYQGEPRKLGFYDSGGAPVMLMGHDPSFDTSAKGGTLRILLRFWGAAIASSDRYVAQVEEGAVGHAVAGEEVPLLALLGMWLQRHAEGYADAGGMSA